MKLKDINIDWCIYCKEQINIKNGLVIDKKGKCYHLDCYLINLGEDEETNE